MHFAKWHLASQTGIFTRLESLTSRRYPSRFQKGDGLGLTRKRPFRDRHALRIPRFGCGMRGREMGGLAGHFA